MLFSALLKRSRGHQCNKIWYNNCDGNPYAKTINATKWRMLFRFSEWVAL